MIPLYPRSSGPQSPRRSRPILLGHRGASKYLAENTLQAFDLALQHGCDGFEFDARLTSDRAALICHDRDYKGKLLAECPSVEFPGLLTLGEVLKRYSSQCFLNLELKVEGLHDVVIAAFQKHKPQ